ncbi:MAG TPA: DUF4249 domain-containing protein, partial [Cytophagaceae bacterium]
MKKYIIIHCVLFILASCVDKYKPDLSPASENIVVEGLITNVAEPYTVKLTRLKNVYESFSDSLSGALVTVSDNDGKTYLFQEKTQGIYQSDPNVFTALVGKKYTLKVDTKEGQKLQSSEELMMDSQKIESVNNVYKDASSGNRGFYVYIHFKDLPEEGNYYRWETTYYPTKPRCGDINPCCGDCWYVRRTPENIVVSSDENYNNKLVESQIYILAYESRSKVFINIVQYSTTASTYTFWKELRKQISNVGSIFDPTPASIA